MPDGTHTGSESETDGQSFSVSESGMQAMRTVEEGIGSIGKGVWKFFHDLPFHGAIVGGAVGLGAAMVVGVAELVTAGFSAYVTYRMFAYGESLTEAIENTIRFEKGVLSKDEIEKPIVE